MKCVESTGICTKVSNPADGYYIPSTDDTTNKLYSYSSNAWTQKTSLEVGFYLSGADFDSDNSVYTKLIQCTTSTSCSFVTSTDIVINKFYINGDGATSGTPVTYKSLIKCTAQESCTKESVTAAGFYLDAQTPANVITCTYASNTASCTTNTGSTADGTGYIDAGTTGNVIICDSSTNSCSSIIKGNAIAAVDAVAGANGQPGTPASPAQNTGFLDAGTSGNLIICSNTGGCNSSSVTGAQGQAILDGKSYASSKFTKLIKWKSGTTWEYLSTPSQTEVYIDAGSCTVSGSNRNCLNIIKYSTDAFVVEAGLAKTTGKAYIDATDKNKIITCDTTKCTSNANDATTSSAYYIDGFNDKNIISCTGADADCSSNSGSAASVTNYYLDSMNEGLFKCDSGNSCEKVASPVNDDGKGYLDAGSTNENVIVCDSNSKCKSLPKGNAQAAPEGGVVQNTGFLDAGTSGNLIICSYDDGCNSDSVTGAQGQAILDGKSYTESDKFTKLIKWNSSNSAWAYEDSPSQTEAYIDAGSVSDTNYPNVIVYDTTNKFVVKEGGDKSTGIAYIDATDKKNIITCDSGNCGSVANSASTGNEKFYIDGNNNKKIIKCTAASSECSSSDGSTSTTTKFYIDSNVSTNVIKCDKGNACTSIDGNTVDGYGYIDSGNEDKNVIICTEDGCSTIVGGNAPTVKDSVVQKTGFLDAGVDGNLIVCTNGSTCVSSSTTGAQGQAILDGKSYDTTDNFTKLIKWKTGTTWEYVDEPSQTEAYIDIGNCNGTGTSQKCPNVIFFKTGDGFVVKASSATTTGVAYIDATNKIKIIKCDANTCISESNGAATPSSTYFIDGINKANIITCTNADSECSSATGASTGTKYYLDSINEGVFKCATGNDCSQDTVVKEDGKGYLDAGSSDKNVIVCDNTTSKCKSLPYGNAQTAPEGGVVQNTGFLDVGTAGNLIICINGTGCTTSSITGAAGQALLDGKSYTTEAGFTKVIENNTAWKLATTTPLAGEVYIDVSSPAETGKYPNIITYTDSKYTVVAGKSTVGYGYIDPITKVNIIRCDGTTCTSNESGGTDSLTKNYIDGTDPKKIISCDDTSCVSNVSGATESVNKYYVDGTTPANIIKCTNTDDCASSEGSTVEGEAYIDGNSNANVITCVSGDGCTSDVGNKETDEIDTYVNADDLTQIVKCTTECIIINTNPSANNSAYYARYNDEGTIAIIKCHATSKCNLDKETIPKANAVFINALFTEDANANGDHENPLIICDKDAKCKPVSPEFTVPATEAEAEAQSRKRDTQQSGTKQVEEEQSATPIPNYYVNGDADSSQRIIKCAAEGKKCTIMNAADKNVYLNANYDATNNNKPLIKCTTNESVLNCAEVEETSSDDNRTYYLNAGTSSKEDAVIECAASCGILEAKSGQIYINNNDTSQLISCSDTGCILKTSNASKEKNEIYLNSSDIDNKYVVHTNDLIICTKGEGEDDKVTCVPSNGVENGVYLNADDKSKIIICLKDEECKYVSSDATTLSPKYYVNGDPTNDTDEKLKNDLIKCKKVNNGVTCDVISGNHGDTYLNANTDDEANPLIVCTTDGGCIASTSDANNNDNLPVYYVNTGSGLADKKLNDTLIKCTMENDKVQCDIKRDTAVNQVYVNYGTNKSENQLIKCTANACKTYSSNPTENNNEYYINSGDVDEASLTNDIIECVCAKEEGKETCSVTCTEMNSPGVGVYLNSNYSSVGDTNQLISCTNEDGCKGITSASDSKTTEYYVNAEATDLTNAIIFCSNKKCEKQTAVLNTYYVGVGEDPEINGLIECIKTEKEETTQTQTTQTQEGQAQQPAQVAGQNAKRGTITEEKCKLNLSNSYQGYYLNAGSNKAINQVIVCDSSEGCKSEKVDLGYYVNAGDSTKPIIKCEKEGSECTADESPKCPADENATAGDYCYEEDQLKFFVSSNSTAIVATKSDDYYAFAEIASGNFPGIKTTTGSLFKISRYFINRFYKGGVVMIDKNGKLVDNLSSSDQSDISLYECNESTKLCTEKLGCTSNTYMFDSENGKAVFCNSGKLEYAEFTGYVIDSNRMVGTNHPYIIECQNNGAKCTSMKPKTSSYFENSGYDSTTNSLIECSNNNCSTVVADVGYYVGHEGEGIIQCTSSSSCTYSVMKNKSVKYVNAGSNKTSKAIIECTKNKCSAAKAKIGYYMTYSNTILIQCTSPSNCIEFTPTVNYYDNADSSESSNSIINCAQSSQVITCAPEATNNGFYMSSSPNVLIRCKSGSKCKTVVVKNGIFRGALKGLSSSNKRSDEEDIELEEGDGRSVAMPRDSDEAYGIIRCVAGKCSALSPSEVASIPVCEFNNNKCYITLEYSMTKSATTSISAGNICTNADRSVFYFATDTIVVKPNVISGVTATYVYTTTNSNCLEVNDSYTDMYFTVGSNIFTLDQGSVLQFYETGYYFINTNKNTLVSGNDIDAYNDENVKLYKCNGSSCSITDKPDSLTYYVDVNKRIFKYNINNDAYSFAYDKDIMCIFANNKCTPNADLKNKEFCITYKGELALVKQDIKNRETGECYKASSITNTIYGYSQYLYNMNMFSAEMVDETGYYIISLSTNTTVVSKNYKTKNNNLVVYGCQLSSCKEYTPDEDTYYYDARAKNILRYKDSIWSSPSTSGYAYISIDPATTYIYRFTKNLDEIKINGIANYGYYYTVDGEMYHCDRDEDGECTPIDSSGYYFTNAGEVYYCVHDSENIEPTECTKQACVSGQYYYIDEAYYRCESSSSLVPVMSRYCSYNDNVIINFPLALTEEFPEKIKQAIEGVEKNNNSTAIVSRRGKNYLESVSGVFTNCTYNVEETKSTFDLVCVNNYVSIDENTDDVKICSMEQLGYVECIEDEENPEKCNVSGAFPMVRPALFTIIMLAFSLLLLNQF